MNRGFNNDKYLQMQSEKIRERINSFGDKLYLEFGGKLFDDYHASRVLPGFEPDSKMQMLLTLKDQAEVVVVVSAKDIESSKIRADLAGLDVLGGHHHDHFGLILEGQKHLHLRVRLKPRQHTAGVVIVKQFSSEFQIQLVTERIDSFTNFFRLHLEVLIIIESSVH